MIELLIVIAILGVLLALLIATLGTGQLEKSRDARRKDNLSRIKIAFEEYYNDNGCYPEPGVLDECGSNTLSPYMSSVPCDPTTKLPYIYVPNEDNCSGYRVYAALERSDDPVVGELGCQGGCGVVEDWMIDSNDPRDPNDYNYGVSEGVAVGPGGDGVTPPLTEGYCCPAAGQDCQVWQYGHGSCNVGPFESMEACYVGSGCVP